MLLIKPKDIRFHKRRLKSNLSFLRLSLVDQFMRLMEGSITGMKDCSWSINCSPVAVEIMICRACCDVAVAQINYPSFKHNTQNSIEQARGRSHGEDSSQIFMLDDMQFGGV
jgi:hypothetical protein